MPASEEARIEALEARVAELEVALRRADELAAFEVHELKTPIASLEGYAFLLAREAGGGAGDGDTQRRCQAGIARNIARALALLDEMLEIGRARLGRLALEREALDLADLAREAARGTVGVEVAAEGPAAVRGDRRRLLALLRDMLADARERAGAGAAVRLVVAARGGEAVVLASDPGAALGRGVLEAGFFGTRRTGGAEGGEGGGALGLALGREVVRLLGGRTWAESGGGGNAIGFALPLGSAQRG
jgi:signal transduction histidine kinase